MSGTPGPKLLRAMLRSTPSKIYGGSWFHKVKVLSSGNGQCRFEMRVEEEHLNLGETMHGGCTATIIDIASIMTIGTVSDNSLPAVSVDLNISFLKPAKLGDDLYIDTKLLRSGKTLAFVETMVSKKDDGSLIAVGKQIMAKTPPSKGPPPTPE